MPQVDLGGAGVQKLIGQIGDAILFIDEAPSIVDGPLPKVKAVITALLTAAENKRDKMSIFLAGLLLS